MTRPRTVAAPLFALSLVLCSGLAAPRSARAQESSGATTSHTERPPAGSWRRGIVPLPAAAVVAVGALIVAAAGAALTWRARKSRR
jgi:hypothetical protein